MEAKNKVMLAIAIASVITLGWFFRYEIHVVSAGGQGAAGFGYMVNRWTGAVFVLRPASMQQLREPGELKDLSD